MLIRYVYKCTITVRIVNFKLLQRGKNLIEILKNLLHITERVQNSIAIIIGQDLESVQKNAHDIEHKFLFAEVTKSLLMLHPFCPNCTNSAESWPRVRYAWADGWSWNFAQKGKSLFHMLCSIKGENIKNSSQCGPSSSAQVRAFMNMYY